MMCEDAGKLIPLFLYGELSFDEEEGLEGHLDGCAECRAEVKRLQDFHSALDWNEAQVSTPMLLQCRRNLRSSVLAMGEDGRQHSGIFAFLRHLLPTNIHFGVPAQSVGAVALLAAGFFSARMLPTDRSPLQSMGTTGQVYERVREVEPSASGRVQIVVEQVSRRTLSGGMGDEPIQRLLLTAARESNDPGVRVESVDLLKNSCTRTDVRDALLYILQHDANPGLRLKALEGLRSTAADPDTMKALAHVLLTDQNAGVRTQAIDILTSQKEPSMVGVFQQVMGKEDNSYVRLRCQKALHEMKASAETF